MWDCILISASGLDYVSIKFCSCVTLDWLVFNFHRFWPVCFLFIYFFRVDWNLLFPITVIVVFEFLWLVLKWKSYPDLVPCWFQRVIWVCILHDYFLLILCSRWSMINTCIHKLDWKINCTKWVVVWIEWQLGELSNYDKHVRLGETWEVVTLIWELTSLVEGMRFGFGAHMGFCYSTFFFSFLLLN